MQQWPVARQRRLRGARARAMAGWRLPFCSALWPLPGWWRRGCSLLQEGEEEEALRQCLRARLRLLRLLLQPCPLALPSLVLLGWLAQWQLAPLAQQAPLQQQRAASSLRSLGSMRPPCTGWLRAPWMQPLLRLLLQRWLLALCCSAPAQRTSGWALCCTCRSWQSCCLQRRLQRLQCLRLHLRLRRCLRLLQASSS
jgi:hypothetical protein